MWDGRGRSAGGAGHCFESQGSWLPTAPGPPPGHGLGASVEGQRRRWGGAFVTGSHMPGPGPPRSAPHSPPPAGPPRVCPQAPLPPAGPARVSLGQPDGRPHLGSLPRPPALHPESLRRQGPACAEQHLLPTPTPRGPPATVSTGSEVIHLGPAASLLSGAEAAMCGELSGGPGCALRPPRLGQGWAPTSSGHVDDFGRVDPVVSAVVGKHEQGVRACLRCPAWGQSDRGHLSCWSFGIAGGGVLGAGRLPSRGVGVAMGTGPAFGWGQASSLGPGHLCPLSFVYSTLC